MDLFEIIQKDIKIFLNNSIEDKKTISLIELINTQLSDILTKFDEFKKFSNNQLNGNYSHKIVMAKSLKEHYNNWSTIDNACNLLKKEEDIEINKFYTERNSLIENLKTLLKDSQKSPVVSGFDVYDDSYFQLRSGHPVIILGGNNTIVIDKIIHDLETNFIAEGHYNEILPVELSVNYANLKSNTSMCNEKTEELYYNKKGKTNKLTTIVENMIPIGEKLVFFATYKEEMINIGCNQKELDLYEKDLLKKYVPLKKHLQKALKITFLDICDIVVDENDFYSENTDSENDNFFDEFISKNEESDFSFNENELDKDDSIEE